MDGDVGCALAWGIWVCPEPCTKLVRSNVFNFIRALDNYLQGSFDHYGFSHQVPFIEAEFATDLLLSMYYCLGNIEGCFNRCLGMYLVVSEPPQHVTLST